MISKKKWPIQQINNELGLLPESLFTTLPSSLGYWNTAKLSLRKNETERNAADCFWTKPTTELGCTNELMIYYNFVQIPTHSIIRKFILTESISLKVIEEYFLLEKNVYIHFLFLTL